MTRQPERMSAKVNPVLADADGNMDSLKAGDAFLACLSEAGHPPHWLLWDYRARTVEARWRTAVPEAVVQMAGKLVGITFGEGDTWSVRFGDDKEPGRLVPLQEADRVEIRTTWP